MLKIDSVTIKICDGRRPVDLFWPAHFRISSRIIQVIVSEDAEFRAAEFGGVHDAGVHEFVHDDDIVLPE